MVLSEDDMKKALKADTLSTSQVADYRLIETTVLEKLNQQKPVAYMTYKGYLLHADDPKVAEHSDPEPLYANPIENLELVGEVVLGQKDVGTMRTVVWKSGILPEVGSKIYVNKPPC